MISLLTQRIGIGRRRWAHGPTSLQSEGWVVLLIKNRGGRKGRDASCKIFIGSLALKNNNNNNGGILNQQLTRKVQGGVVVFLSSLWGSNIFVNCVFLVIFVPCWICFSVPSVPLNDKSFPCLYDSFCLSQSFPEGMHCPTLASCFGFVFSESGKTDSLPSLGWVRMVFHNALPEWTYYRAPPLSPCSPSEAKLCGGTGTWHMVSFRLHVPTSPCISLICTHGLGITTNIHFVQTKSGPLTSLCMKAEGIMCFQRVHLALIFEVILHTWVVSPLLFSLDL